ncbi:hypothetical protein [Paraburkholderia sediminicola]|uniref:hypothetical protein n=1 Tax=Paraburkholderia sediminicola TaxID=458836 RepID=UPI0038BACA7C
MIVTGLDTGVDRAVVADSVEKVVVDKYPENSRDVTLRRMRRAIEGKQWTARLETDWLMARLRILLGW